MKFEENFMRFDKIATAPVRQQLTCKCGSKSFILQFHLYSNFKYQFFWSDNKE